ncbi:MAG: hypothetical protein M3Q10_02875 [Chloroflexota bacterium]|nr:hypothetical protein [Chloroflexota bacterium]
MPSPKARSWQQQVFHLGIEALTAPGAPVAATKRLGGIRLDPGYDVNTDTVKAGGSRVSTSILINTEVMEWDVSGFNSYHDLCYIIASILGAPTITALGGGAYEWLWTAKARTAPRPQTYTSYWGDEWETLRAAHLYFNEWNIDVTRAALDFSATARSYAAEYGIAPPQSEIQTITITGAPTGGTFTLTFNGQVTAAIPYNATAAQVKAALEALSTIGADNIVASGGPLPATAVDVAFAGDFAGTDVALMTATAAFTGGATPAITVATTRTANVPTGVDPVIIQTKNFDAYLDDSWAALGTTKLRACYQANPGFGGQFSEAWTINSANNSFDSIITAEDADFPVTVQVALDAVGRGLLENTFRRGNRKYLRIQQNGDIITGTIPYSFRLDSCFYITDPNIVNGDDVVVATLEGTMAEDPTTGNYAAVRIVNTLAGL